MPPAGALATGVSATSHVRPRSSEWKTRETTSPPVPNQASRPPAVSRHVPLAAKPNSPGSASGMPLEGRSCQLSPPSLVERIWNLPADGVAHHEPAVAVEERHAVVERGRIGVLEGLRPGGAAVLGDVDPRGVARADREQHRVVGVRTPRCRGTAARPRRAGRRSARWRRRRACAARCRRCRSPRRHGRSRRRGRGGRSSSRSGGAPRRSWRSGRLRRPTQPARPRRLRRARW